MKKEFGKWLMDIAKYLVTGILLTSVFADMDKIQLTIYVLIVGITLLSIGLILIKSSEKTFEENNVNTNDKTTIRRKKHGRN